MAIFLLGALIASGAPQNQPFLEALLLANGHLLLIYNNNTSGPRDQLAVSISEDRGGNLAMDPPS